MSRCWRPASDLASAADTTSRPKHRLIISPVSLTPRLPNLLLCSAVPKGNPKSGWPLGRRPHSRTNNVSAEKHTDYKGDGFYWRHTLNSTQRPIPFLQHYPYILHTGRGLDIHPCHGL